MTENSNEGSCPNPKCDYNKNALTALKCEYCGHQMKKTTTFSKPLIFGLILLLGILGSGSYFLFKDKFTTAQTQNTENVVNVANDDKNTSAVIDIPADSPERYSSGERILLRYKSNADAKNGVQEFAAGNYDEALKFFEKAIEGDRPNPEPQIYLNNTKARLAKSFFTMAVVVPVDNSATSAEEILRGVADAQTKFNEAGGLNGKLLEIAIANDGNDPKIAVGVAQKLSDNPKILAVVGHNSSDASEAALPVYEKKGLAMVSSTSTSPSLSGNIFFRAVISDEISGKGLAKYTATSTLKKVAIFYNPQSSYSMNMQKAFTSEFQKSGGQIVREIDMSNPNLLSKDEVKSLQGQADAIVLFPNKDFISVAIGILQANGQLPVEQRMKILAGNTMYDPMTITSGANAAEGLIVPVPWFSNTSYGKKAEQRWLGQVNWRTAASYDAIRALTSALSDNSSRDSILKNLQSVDLVFSETSGDVLRFSSQRERLGQPILVEVTRGTGAPQGSPFAFKPIQHSN